MLIQFQLIHFRLDTGEERTGKLEELSQEITHNAAQAIKDTK